MTCTPEHGSVKKSSQSLIAITKNLLTPNSPEITALSEEAADEMSTTPETTQENFSESCPQTERTCDGTDTDHYMQPEVDTSVEPPDRTPTNPATQNMIHVIIQSQIVMTFTDIEPAPLHSTESIRILSGNPGNVLWN